MITRSNAIKFKKIAFFFFVILSVFLVILVFVSIGQTRNNHKAQALILDLNRGDSEARQQLIKMLDGGGLNQRTGCDVIKAISNAKVYVRKEYPVGTKIFAAVEIEELYFQHLLINFDATTIAGQENQRRTDTKIPLVKGVHYFELVRALHSDGDIRLLNDPGNYEANIKLSLKLFPAHPSKWKWPSDDPFPWNFLPKKVILNSGKGVNTNAYYTCDLNFPVRLQLVSKDESSPMVKISNPTLDEKVKKAFSVHQGNFPFPFSETLESSWSLPGRHFARTAERSKSIREGVYVSYEALPIDISLRGKFRDIDGREYISEFSFADRAGGVGQIGLNNMADVFLSLSAGVHRGDLILFTDEDVAYENPLITNVWLGTLVFPVEFTIEKFSKDKAGGSSLQR